MCGGKPPKGLEESQSDVRFTVLTPAALQRTEQTVRCPECRLGAQEGVSLVVSAASCVSASRLSYNLFQGRLFWCLETPLLGSRKPSRAQKAPYFPLTLFSFPLKPNQICPYITASWASSLSPNAQSTRGHGHILFRWCWRTSYLTSLTGSH